MSESYSIGDVVGSGGVEVSVECCVCSGLFESGDRVFGVGGESSLSGVRHWSCWDGAGEVDVGGVVVCASRVNGSIVPREFGRESAVPIDGVTAEVEDVVLVVRESLESV